MTRVLRRAIAAVASLALSAGVLVVTGAPAHAFPNECIPDLVGTGSTQNNPTPWWGGWPDGAPLPAPHGTTFHSWTKFKCTNMSDPNHDFWGMAAVSTWHFDGGVQNFPATMFQQIYSDTPGSQFKATDSFTSHTDCSVPVSLGLQWEYFSIGYTLQICNGYGITRYGFGNTSAEWTSATAGELETVETVYSEVVPKGVVPKFDVNFGVPQYITVPPTNPVAQPTTKAHLVWDRCTDAGGANSSCASRFPGGDAPAGRLDEVTADSSGWHDASTGLTVAGYSAVNMGGQWPQVMSLDAGVIHQIYGDANGWHEPSTGMTADRISAVNMGGAWPVVMALEGGVIHEITGDASGWHDGSTGIIADQISAVNMGGRWPVVMALKDGVIHEISGDNNGWHDGSTGITADQISAVNMGGQWPVIMVLKGGVIHEISGDSHGWHDGSTGISADQISAVNMGAAWPQVMAVKGGVLHQVYGDSTGWHDGSTGITARAVSAVNFNRPWPVSMIVK